MERPESAAQVVGKRTIFEAEHDDYRESFRRFLEKEVVPEYPQWERDHIVPKSLFTKCAEYGFLSMEVPEEYGGPGVDDWRFNVVLAEESVWAGVGAGMGGPLLHTDIVVPYIMSTANEEQKQRWLPQIASGEKVLAVAMTEPGTGSDLAAISTRGKRDGEGWIVNGAKTFITNGINADQVVVAVRTSDDPHGGLSLFVIEEGMEGFERGKQIEKLGQHASDTSELFFNDCYVPQENMLGEEGSGFLQLVSRLVPERLTLSVSSMAGAEAALAMTIDYAKERKAFGRPIANFQHNRFTLAELRTEIEIGRCFIDRCIERYVDGTCTVEEAAMAKWWTTELVSKVTDAGVQLHGGYGYTTEYRIGKAWVDARVGRIYAGTNEIMKELIGKTMGL
ncbi:MAG TPA: acyl-CoA dehydrogenase family protein [Solirubrobacterales bacterium]|nr:acyl-CoA dehydrogenase family protein [Solirubrobacterales bacterium]HMU25821.1 acyl-CoA dehydrogenase family protein [Solirubrobacterales bacterium]HMX70212.1 acyl-CoA dehydrogenase family protein [Solirubrobacterales bacterium]HMY25878.1 acyl-CoA dehydrogenase family protein [Solirubrobacterales bacterium]HNA24572.1 acyl-CoA dehydrogenase family protein [Solirubrobacterales bacterium]